MSSIGPEEKLGEKEIGGHTSRIGLGDNGRVFFSEREAETDFLIRKMILKKEF